MTKVVYLDPAMTLALLLTENIVAVPLTFDIRDLNQAGFRISNTTVGDEKFQRLSRSPQTVFERLQNAWRLAFAECPSAVKTPF
jgi:hypothetical protein